MADSIDDVAQQAPPRTGAASGNIFDQRHVLCGEDLVVGKIAAAGELSGFRVVEGVF